MKYVLIFLMVFLFSILILLPFFSIFVIAFSSGIGPVLETFSSEEVVSALRLSAVVLSIVIPINLVFGILSSWAIAKCEFYGKSLLLTLIDLPLSISPVISGMIFIFLLGPKSPVGSFFLNQGLPIIFSTPGIVIVTLFVTFPILSRELIPLMQAQGREEEEASLILGASLWQTFWKVTLPNIKWGLVSGIILSGSRALGEFGAVSVVSGHIRNQTNTLPLQVEVLYNDYNSTGAFSVAMLLAVISIVTLLIKKVTEHLQEKQKLEQSL